MMLGIGSGWLAEEFEALGLDWHKRGLMTDESIQSMWNGSAEMAEVRRLTVDVKQMVDAHPTPGFSFCPGLAEKETGHSTHLYPVARLILDLRKGTLR